MDKKFIGLRRAVLPPQEFVLHTCFLPRSTFSFIRAGGFHRYPYWLSRVISGQIYILARGRDDSFGLSTLYALKFAKLTSK